MIIKGFRQNGKIFKYDYGALANIPSNPGGGTSVSDEALAQTVDKLSNDLTELDNAEKKSRHGIRRKLNALSGSVRRMASRFDDINQYINCRVTTVENDYIVIYFLDGNVKKYIRLAFTENSYKYEVTRFNGIGFNRASLYTPTTVDKTITSVYIDNVAYDNLDALKQVDFTFRECVITYTALVNELQCLTTLVINRSGITVYETMDDPTQLIDTFVTGELVNDVAVHGDTKFFVLNNGANHFMETVERNNNTVIKRIRFGGGE